MNPRSMPKASRSTLLMGARQLVVHEALEITSCFFGSYFSWLMPKATVKSWPLAGAEMITFFAPAAMCFCASTRLVKDRKSTRLNSSHLVISYAVFCLEKKNQG